MLKRVKGFFWGRSPLQDQRKELVKLREAHTQLSEMHRFTTLRLSEAHSRLFIAECCKHNAEELVRVNANILRAEVNAFKIEAQAEKERVLGLVDAARSQAEKEDNLGAYVFLSQLIIDISTGGKKA